MTERGVLASFNSDSSELARRLNLEVAKAVRWGNMTPEDALKLVTINPAKQLGIDKMVGSLETGKDADLVVWSGDPLSTRTICERTFVDGKLLFDRQADLAQRPQIEAEKRRLAEAERPAGARRQTAPPAGRGARSAATGTPGRAPAASNASPARSPVGAGGASAGGTATVITGATIHPIPAGHPNGVLVVRGGRIAAMGPASSSCDSGGRDPRQCRRSAHLPRPD
jgi:hypothetical protein